tara:strand:+ start:431 stop:655 length:225 start_codon:yes stop_codon:yes gene_type:complete
MNQIVNIIKEDMNKLKSNYLAISFLICTSLLVGIINTLITIIFSILLLAIFLYFKDEFDYQKAKQYFTKKGGKQ